jgi:DNA-binding XRE family transcriptional regulator
MNVRTLLNIETGKTIPSLFYAIKLANFLNLPVDQLFEYKNADLPSNEGEDCHEK